MIIQALNDYYKRLKEDPEVAIPPFGFSMEKIGFALVLNKAGKLLQVDDLRDKSGKKPTPKIMIVPAHKEDRTSGIRPNFMWDNAGYVLGKHKDKKRFTEFKKFQHLVGDDIEDAGMKAVLSFLDSWNPDNDSNQLELLDDMEGANIVFQLEGERMYVHEHNAIEERWVRYLSDDTVSDHKAFCLVSGGKRPIARLHRSLRGLPPPAQPSGASIISFNKDAFLSYNKDQNYNAPVNESAAFNYITALKHLLLFDSRQKIQIGDATTVFWAEGNTPLLGFLKDILDPNAGQPDVSELEVFLNRVRDGKKPKELTDDTKNLKFYILGVSPNAGRLSVRFWHVDSVEGISMKLGQHFDDLKIIRRPEYDREFPGMWHLLHELELSKKDDKNKRKKIKDNSPLIAGAFFRSIITGSTYPRSILAAVIERIRATQEINYLRVALIKAYLNRINRVQKNNKEVTMALNENETNAGYLLGRLFAVLEKVQKDAVPGANATIKDRFYGSASATPSVVFPQLMRLAQHHISKAEYGHVSGKRIQDIMQNINKFPTHLNLEDQGMFSIGYYHQQPELYKKTIKEEKK